jgi:pyrroline-5-carboxylate reductase
MDQARIETLGIIGVGGLAEYCIEGFRRSGDQRDILLSPRNAERAADLAKRFGCRIMPSNQAVVDAADAVMVATPPKAVLNCVQELHWRKGQLLICVALVSVEPLRLAAPQVEVVRTMPITAASFGASAMALFPEHARARALLSPLGPLYAVPDERAFEAGAAYAAYYMWLHVLMEEMVKSGAEAGLPRDAALGIVCNLTAAAGRSALHADPKASVREWLERHGGPGSMTVTGYAMLKSATAFESWKRAYDNAVELQRRAPNG